ncbi:MAG: Trk system potassium transporter TrkA [Parachlamydiaceae bacterium]
MNIVIIGAGDVGLYIATLLSKQKHNVTLIDKDGNKLNEISWQMDVAIQQGSGTDWQLLDSLLDLHPDLLIALTSQDETNLVACSIAKNLGYPKTIARVRDNLYLNRTRLDFARIYHVDSFISPELLVANEMYKYIVSPNSLAFENFAHGEVQMRTLQIPGHWKFGHEKISKLKLPKGIILGLIYRQTSKGERTLIFPHGSDAIEPGDEVTLIGQRHQMSDIHRFFENPSQKVDKVKIVGGTLVGKHLAHILEEQHIAVSLIDKHPLACQHLAKTLPGCSIIQQDGTDLDFLLSENINPSDYYIMCTYHDETNILGALVAKEAGYQNIAITLSNNRFLPLMHHLGIVHIVSPKLAAANQIIGLTTSKSITSLVSLYENEAEILEITVSSNSQIIGIPLSEIGPRLPKDFLIMMIQSRGNISIAKGDSVISPGDTVIVICNPKYFQELGNIF